MWWAALGLVVGAHARDLPVESVSYTVDVTGPLAEITIDQTFRNDSDAFIEATYVFPLQPDAAVDQMRIVVGERIIQGEIRDREEAREIYADAVAEGRVAALTEEERPNVFTQHVANIGPGETLHVELHVIQPVPRIGGAYQLVLPLVVAPRFVPDGVPDADRIPGGTPGATGSVSLAPTGLDVDIDVVVHAGLAVRSVESPSHAVAAEIDGDDISARVDDVPADRDFVLRWKTAGDEPEVAFLVSGDHGIVTFEPPALSTYEERVPRELIWVVDTSCSMSGEPLNLAKRAMDEALQQMDPADSFLVLGFGNDVTALSRSPVQATEREVERGREFVRGLKADGGTMMMKAVLAALNLPTDRFRHRVVAFVTDGQIGNDDEVLKTIAAHPEITFATLGIGAAPNRYLLDEMALLGGGVSAYATGRLSPEGEMIGLLDAMDRPVLTEVQVDWMGWDVESAFPSRIPDLHTGQPVLVAARLDDGSGPIRITGRIGSGSFTQVVQPESVQNRRPMATTWARQKVADVHRRYLRREIADEKPLIRETGLEYHILTDYTAFVAVEKDRVVNPDGPPVPVEQPLDMPEGQVVASAGSTETITVSARSSTVDVSNVTRGEVLTKDFLQAIPTGRTYQSAVTMAAGVVGGGGNPNMAGSSYNENTYMLDGVNLTDPVSGAFSMDLNYDALQVLDVVGSGRDATYGGGGAVVDANGIDGTNNLEASASFGVVQGSGDGEPIGGYDVSASVLGPLVHDKLWLATAWSHRGESVGGLHAVGDEVYARLTAQPWSQRRFTGTFVADPLTVDHGDGGDPSVYGGVLGMLRWQEFVGSDAMLDTVASAHRSTVQGDDRRRQSVGTTFTSFAGAHTLEAGFAWDRVQWSTPDHAAKADVAGLFAHDRWQLAPGLTLAAGDRVERLSAAEGRWMHSPRGSVAWDPTGTQKTRVDLGASRSQDTDRLLVGALDADGRPARTDEAFAGAEVEVVQDVAIGLTGTLRDERFPFAPANDLVAVDGAADAPWLDLSLARAEIALRKVSSHRWQADLRYGYTASLSDAPKDLLADAGAPWVPGFLARYRSHALTGSADWALPLDPWQLSIGAFGSWASPIAGPDEAWWLRAPRAGGVRLAGGVPVRKGHVTADVSATWALNDAAAAVLPLQVHALEPGAPSVGELAPLRIDASVGYRF